MTQVQSFTKQTVAMQLAQNAAGPGPHTVPIPGTIMERGGDPRRALWNYQDVSNIASAMGSGMPNALQDVIITGGGPCGWAPCTPCQAFAVVPTGGMPEHLQGVYPEEQYNKFVKSMYSTFKNHYWPRFSPFNCGLFWPLSWPCMGVCMGLLHKDWMKLMEEENKRLAGIGLAWQGVPRDNWLTLCWTDARLSMELENPQMVKVTNRWPPKHHLSTKQRQAIMAQDNIHQTKTAILQVQEAASAAVPPPYSGSGGITQVRPAPQNETMGTSEGQTSGQQFCGNCGTALNGNKFCPQCGTKSL